MTDDEWWEAVLDGFDDFVREDFSWIAKAQDKRKAGKALTQEDVDDISYYEMMRKAWIASRATQEADLFWCDEVMTPLPRPDFVAYRYGELFDYKFETTIKVHQAVQVGGRKMRVWRDVEGGGMKWEWVK